MTKEELKELTTDQLKSKAKGIKTLMFLFVPVILGLAYFFVKEMIESGDKDISVLVTIVCSVIGMLSLVPALRKIKEELGNRE